MRLKKWILSILFGSIAAIVAAEHIHRIDVGDVIFVNELSGDWTHIASGVTNTFSSLPGLLGFLDVAKNPWDTDEDVNDFAMTNTVTNGDIILDTTDGETGVVRIQDLTISDASNIANAGTYNSVTVETHAARHILGGGDEADGDQIDIDFTPTDYTPTTTPPEASDLNHLTAHLGGIDIELGTLSAVNVSIGTVTTTDATLTTVDTIGVDDDTSMFIDVSAVALRTDATDGHAAYIRRALIHRIGTGSTAIEGGVDTTFERESLGAWDVTIAVSTTNVLIQVTGDAGQTVNWKSGTTILETQ